MSLFAGSLENMSNISMAKTIKKFVDREKGRTFLDMITPSDVAYSISLIKNSQDVWKESNKISKMPEEVQKNTRTRITRTL